jgi:oligopeptidase A
MFFNQGAARSVFIIILVVQAYAKDSIDELVEKLVDRLAGRVFQVLPPDRANLDITTLGKPALQTSKPQKNLAVVPQYQASPPHFRRPQLRDPLSLGHCDAIQERYGTRQYNSRRQNCLAASMNTPETSRTGHHVFASAVADNALLMQEGLPKFSKIEANVVEPAVQKCINDMMTDFKSLESQLDESSAQDKAKLYEETVEKLEKIQFPLSYSWGVVGHLMGVKNSDELREVHQTMQPKVVETMQSMSQSRPLYDAMLSIQKDAGAWDSLTEPQQRIVNSSILSMQQSGVGLDTEQREEFNKLQLEAAGLSTKFSNNLLDSTKAFRLKITDKEKLKGLPPSALALAAQQSGENATAEAGPWTLTLDIPSYLPSMQHLQDRALREQLYRAYLTRASEGPTDNSNIILRILQVRKKMAQMLGQPNWAEVSLLKKMAPSVERVEELTEMLRQRSFPGAEKELAELQAFAEKEYNFEGKLQLWDVSFFSERLREKLYSFTDEELRPYFPMQEVLKGLFELAQRLFDVKIVAADGQEEVWHPDVQFFKVFDANSEQHMASFFLDPYSRPADKRGGAWMDVCVGRSKVMNRKPVAYLTCNGSPPVGTTPALMTFQEVETLFHEFGHGLQHMLTTVEDAEAAGINGVEWDAVELPSQFMENWCYDERTVMGFAKHHETGEQLPKELFTKIKEAKKFQASMIMLRQLYIGQLDMALHDKFDPDAAEASPFALQKEIAEKFTVLKPLPEDRFLCGFGHIFAGGYAAGYYSYKWAEILSADSFAAFEEAGLENDGDVRRIGRKFRDTVLSMGGGKHPSEVFKAFRGRDPSPEALLRHSGLATVAIGPNEELIPAEA